MARGFVLVAICLAHSAVGLNSLADEPDRTQGNWVGEWSVDKGGGGKSTAQIVALGKGFEGGCQRRVEGGAQRRALVPLHRRTGVIGGQREERADQEQERNRPFHLVSLLNGSGPDRW